MPLRAELANRAVVMQRMKIAKRHKRPHVKFAGAIEILQGVLNADAIFACFNCNTLRDSDAVVFPPPLNAVTRDLKCPQSLPAVRMQHHLAVVADKLLDAEIDDLLRPVVTMDDKLFNGR